MSAVSPETPSNPDCLLSIASTSRELMPSLAAMKSRIAGSRSPDRVPITSPSSGVKPIDVSTDWPADDRARRRAVAEVQRDDLGGVARPPVSCR